MFYFKNFKVDKNDLLIGTISLKIVLNKKRESYIVFTFLNVAVWGTKMWDRGSGIDIKSTIDNFIKELK